MHTAAEVGASGDGDGSSSSEAVAAAALKSALATVERGQTAAESDRTWCARCARWVVGDGSGDGVQSCQSMDESPMSASNGRRGRGGSCRACSCSCEREGCAAVTARKTSAGQQRRRRSG